MNRCPHCGAGGDQACRTNCDGGHFEANVCEDCGSEVDALHDSGQDRFDADLCPDCFESRCEAAWDRQQEDLMSEPPMTLDEQHLRAWEQKQGLRR